MCMKIEVHIFTNCTGYEDLHKVLLVTWRSFMSTFGEYPVKVWLDARPYISGAERYKENLLKHFENIEMTSSLSDGYIKAVKTSGADFLFMLEHDWMFKLEKKISLENICKGMKKDGLFHLRFNKRKNTTLGWDKYLIQKYCGFFKYCRTPNLSNNPHVIDRKKYTAVALPYTKKAKGSKGLEENLLKVEHIEGAIYGDFGEEATIHHLDGKNINKKKETLCF